MKVGELVYLKNVGFPYDRTDDGHESWEGVSCIVTKLNAGASGDMIEVEPLFPVKCGRGHTPMKSCIFFPSSVKRENRPWLRKHIRDIMKLKNALRKAALVAGQIEQVVARV